MKLYRKPNQSGCKFHPGFTNLGQLLLAPPLGEKKFWLLILGFVLVVKLYAWIYCIMKLFTHAPKRGYGDEKNTFDGEFV
jgi:hypothetical protein